MSKITIELYERMKTEMKNQKYGTFITLHRETPHPTLVGFATTDDLHKIFFFTPVYTRKYVYAHLFSNVSFFVNTTNNLKEDVFSALTIAATGKARIGEQIENQEKEKLTTLYLEKNPHMEFVIGPTTELIVIDVTKFDVVTNFQTVVNVIKSEKIELLVRQIQGETKLPGIVRAKGVKIDDLGNFTENMILVVDKFDANQIIDDHNIVGLVELQSTETGIQYSKSRQIPYIGDINLDIEEMQSTDELSLDGYIGILTFHRLK